jgi:hypothetical protein
MRSAARPTYAASTALAFDYTEVQKLLAQWGNNAHVYIPGVGVLSGLQAANYLDSAGTTQGAVDQPVGLVLDAEGAIGVELVTNGDFSAGATGWGAGTGAAISSVAGELLVTSAGLTYGAAVQSFATVVGHTYRITANIRLGTAMLGWMMVGTSSQGLQYSALATVSTSNATVSFTFVATTTTTYIGPQTDNTVSSGTMYADNISVREITGIHASQSTTPSKPILRQDAGGHYYWQFDGVDDSLGLSGPLFQMSDDHCVIAGVKFNSAAGYYAAFSPSQIGGGVTAAAIRIDSPSGKGGLTWTDGTASVNLLTPSSIIGIQSVITAKRNSGVAVGRLNGVQFGTSSTVISNPTMTTAFIGMAWGGDNMNGAIGPIIAIKGTVPDADLLTFERLVGNLSGVTI